MYAQLPGLLSSPSDISKKLSHHFSLHFPIGMGSHDHHTKYQFKNAIKSGGTAFRLYHLGQTVHQGAVYTVYISPGLNKIIFEKTSQPR